MVLGVAAAGRFPASRRRAGAGRCRGGLRRRGELIWGVVGVAHQHGPSTTTRVGRRGTAATAWTSGRQRRPTGRGGAQNPGGGLGGGGGVRGGRRVAARMEAPFAAEAAAVRRLRCTSRHDIGSR
jgi:hypothetical protein